MSAPSPDTDGSSTAARALEADAVDANQTLGGPRSIPPRSCNTCNLKKVRCDRKHPCSRCTRNGKPCVYPPAGPRVRRSKKTIMADMASRLSSLEKSIASAVDSESQGNPGKYAQRPISQPAASDPRRTTSPDEAPSRSREDILVQRGSLSQYFNDILLSKVIGEEQNIETALTTPQATPSEHESLSPFNVHGILSAPNPMQPPSVFHPSKQLALRLWEIYARDEDSCVSLKILHRPTAEVVVFAVIDDPTTAPLDHLALCFSVYFSATVSMRGTESDPGSDSDRRAHLHSFKNGIEQAFAYGDFLDSPSVIGLQALAIYLSALRVHNRGKGMWIVNGLAWRIAQSLGLHRDGQNLGLPPFESEIRRRLWWLLVVRDGRAAEDYGVRDLSVISLMTDVKHPLNIEDSDIYPGMKALPTARNAWTPMTWLLLHIDIYDSLKELEASASQFSEERRQRIMGELGAKMESRYAYCNTVIPRQLFTTSCGRFIFRKLDFTTRQRCFMLQNPGAHNKFATEENLTQALEIIEAGFFTESNELLSQYRWSNKTYPQYHMALYVLWHLSLRPEGPSVEKAWDAVNMIFAALESDEIPTRGFGSKGIVLKALKLKAEAARRKAQSGNEAYKSQHAVTPDDTSPGLFPLGNPGDDWANYSLLGFELQDWSTWTQTTQF